MESPPQGFQEDLAAALEQLQQQVRAEPADVKHRIFLFQLLCLMGQWERGLKQLGLCAEMSPGCLPMAQAYREAIHCEAFRQSVFNGEHLAIVLGEPPRWLVLMMQGLQAEAAGHHSQSAALRSEALELAPTVAGSINDQPFEWICDADSRLGPIMEMLINGRYFWVPFENIKRLSLDPPADLRDLIWMPAQCLWSNGGESMVLIPCRYPGTELSDDNALRISRKTLWLPQPEGAYHGLGQRILTTDVDEYPLMDIRSIELELAPLEDESQ
ncbi:MAG: type VI secretion system accessory protein TagJ [Motiliproteus sp.]